MDSLKVGDKVIYPNQGLGIIENILREKYFGEEFQIYHVRILANDTLILVPSSNAEEIGIRKPISQDCVKDIFKFIGNGGVDVTMNWKGRYKEHVSLMKSGTIEDMALVLKSLFYLQQIKPLSFREKKMMEKAKELVVSEISEVSCIPIPDIENQVLDMLADCYKKVHPLVDS
jgi:CarD family transcriptional regulator